MAEVLPILEAANEERAEEAVALAGSGFWKNMFLRASNRCCNADLSIPQSDDVSTETKVKTIFNYFERRLMSSLEPIYKW